jgi:hypothetical protein
MQKKTDLQWRKLYLQSEADRKNAIYKTAELRRYIERLEAALAACAKRVGVVPKVMAKVKDCARCEAQQLNGGHGPSHEGSRLCRLGESIASGGEEAHCACAACF